MIRIKKGLDLPIVGGPQQTIEKAKDVSTVAVTGFDYIGMKPTMHVKEGDSVKSGQPLFTCKKNEGLIYTAPASGKVVALNRGARRVFQNVVISVEGDEHVSFNSYKGADVGSYDNESIKALLVESGMWTSLRQRPFSKVAGLDITPTAIFVTAMDSNPLAADPKIIINEHAESFKTGVSALSKLSEGKTFICQKAGASVPAPSLGNVESHDFDGPHPAGLPGTHIHFLSPVNGNKTVFYIGYQDVIALGKLVETGKLFNERVISLAGPRVKNPRLLKTRVGADISELTSGELLEGSNRVISGSILNGRTVDEVFKYLGHYHNSVSVIEEQTNNREFLGWHSTGVNKFSLKRIYLSCFTNKKFNLGTDTHGSLRAMVPVGNYEKLIPMDVLPTQLLRALLTHDTDLAQQLGCLEMDEEDLALCTFASVGKKDFGPILRENLTIIEKEG
ncbi:MAG: Na(+)-translocating NADH-quinone reductase subunit A [Bacteriovoracaceae bacterium]|nr:Na(+)-translocating NADH-quinone reductase subunit A [Bacteriovoracaceae bacterium]